MKLLDQKGLPCNLDAERFVLGSILVSGNELFAGIDAVLTADDFMTEANKRLWAACKNLDDAGRQIDRMTVATALSDAGTLASVGGFTYISALDEGMPKLSNIDSYVTIVREKSLLRRIAVSAHSLYSRALMADEEPGNLLASADEILGRLNGNDDMQAEWKNPGEVMTEYPGGLSSFISPTRGGTGIQTPWPLLNNSICGLQGGDMVLLAGRPSHGKSAAALQIAYEAAKYGRGVAYFSLEMSRESLVRRMLSLASGVDSHRMRLGYLNATERQAVSLAASEIETMPIWIDYRGYNSPAIRRAVKRLKARRQVDLVVIDHFHLLKGLGGEEMRVQYARIADDLQRIAKEMNIPFLILTQLNRKCEDENRAPGLSDLAETGKLEQNSDIVLFTFRPEMYSKNREKQELNGLADFILAKQRNGPTAKFQMQFRRDVQGFYECERQDQE
jgi:replicative DNA helicase